jgi:hypothetical protein
MSRLRLVAVPGRTLPREDDRSRIVDGTDASPTDVPSTAYYRRALARGDVAEATDPKPPKA